MLLFAMLLLTSCASTGVIPTGHDENMISKKSFGGAAGNPNEVLADLYIEANDFCSQKSMQLERISEEPVNGIPFVRTAMATLRFRCVQKTVE